MVHVPSHLSNMRAAINSYIRLQLENKKRVGVLIFDEQIHSTLTELEPRWEPVDDPYFTAHCKVMLPKEVSKHRLICIFSVGCVTEQHARFLCQRNNPVYHVFYYN